MATFSFIKFNGVRSPGGYYGKCDDENDFTAYINNDHIMAFQESISNKQSYIEMANGTTYIINKPLADLMNEFGKIQYEV